jgi:hypothetical protein
MKKFNLFMLSIICGAASYAQAPTIQWNQTFGSSKVNGASSVQQTKDSGYIVAGTLIVKLDKNGNTQWQNLNGGRSIQQTTDGGYIVAGEQLILKLNSSGGVIWQTAINGSAFSVQQTTDGGYIVGGNTYSGTFSNNGQNKDGLVIKMDTNGNITWLKSYGGSGNDIVNSIRQTSDGGYVAAGNTTSKNGQVTGTRDTVYGDFWVIRTDVNGNLLWQQTLGGTDYDEANAVKQTTDGGYFVAGWSRSTNGNVTGAHGGYDYWAVKLDANHNLKWEKTYGGTSDDLAYTAEQTADGGYIIGGTTTSDNDEVSGNHGAGDFWVVKTDSLGNLQWQSPYGGSEYETAYSLGTTNDGGYIVAGNTNSTDGQVTGKTSSNYSLWVVKLTGTMSCSCVAPSTGFTTTGITANTATLNWSTIPCALGYEVLYAPLASTTWDTLQVPTNTGSATLTKLKANINYDWKVATRCTSQPNTYSAFSLLQTFKTTKRTVADLSDRPTEPVLDIVISPNPAHSILNLSLKAEQGNKTLEVLNMTGQVVIKKVIFTTNEIYNSYQLDISSLSAGVYCVYLSSANGIISKKFIKQ